ncbi:MAG TPA: cysteine desulfurase family protein [Candidatus Paceibacterota bacterium]|nr:cysteine desulfurase family protein [Candidatus Paceibacterota bacterium]
MESFSFFRKNRIYADAAASMPMTAHAKRELVRLIELSGNPSALHREALAAKKELDSARERVAKAIGAHADEIIFTSGGTEANNLAIFGTLRGRERAHAVTSAIEHSSVLEPLRALAAEGAQVTELPVDVEGKIDIKDLREALNLDTALVSIQMINSEIGTIQDIREVAKTIRHARTLRQAQGEKQHIYFHVDASQAPLWLPLRVDHLGIDLLTLDGQKLGGPRGVGMLYVRRGSTLTPYIYGGGQEAGLRSGTENVALIGAFAAAFEDAQKDAEENAKRTAEVRNYLFDRIEKEIPGVRLNGAPIGLEVHHSARVANNINVCIPGLNGDMAVVALNVHGVAASTRSACDTDEEAPSHVLAAIGLSPQAAKDSIRLTLLPTATKADADRIVKALEKVAARYRQAQ